VRFLVLSWFCPPPAALEFQLSKANLGYVPASNRKEIEKNAYLCPHAAYTTGIQNLFRHKFIPSSMNRGDENYEISV
jgi:hypothetical protein